MSRFNMTDRSSCLEINTIVGKAEVRDTTTENSRKCVGGLLTPQKTSEGHFLLPSSIKEYDLRPPLRVWVSLTECRREGSPVYEARLSDRDGPYLATGIAPLYASARVLQAHGFASGITLELWSDDIPYARMRGLLGKLANFAVSEDKDGELTLVRYTRHPLDQRHPPTPGVFLSKVAKVLTDEQRESMRAGQAKAHAARGAKAAKAGLQHDQYSQPDFRERLSGGAVASAAHGSKDDSCNPFQPHGVAGTTEDSCNEKHC